VAKKENKFRLIIADNKSFEEKVSFPFSVVNVTVSLISLIFIIFVIAFFTIANTRLKEYLPGCNNKSTIEALYKLNMIADSLENDLEQKNRFLANIKRILNDEDTVLTEISDISTESINYDTLSIRSSKEDSLFRAEFENEQMFNLYFSENLKNQGLSKNLKRSSISDFNFFVPIHGYITSHFDPAQNHYGVDIVSSKNEIVKATLPGTVVFANWTLATGHVLAIQHAANIISVYKHCSVLLVKEGDAVEAGDPIAVTGESGEQQTGPHLHFEIWYNGTPTDPTKFIYFE
jgi:lipoprotein NlpD